MTIAVQLKHQTIYEDEARIAIRLPLIPELQAIHPEGNFPLLEDPIATGRAMILGMTVLRPRDQGWTAPVLSNGQPTSLYAVQHWIYTVNGLPGGWLIAHGNLMDAYRLALQYGLADAVMIGSNTVRTEGIDRPGYAGYIWQPYHPTRWPHLQQAAPDLLTYILHQRRAVQQLGYLSDRTYPAQIVVSQSGQATSPDLLEAAIFHQSDPDGHPIEAYILTSEVGASRFRERAATYGLAHRIEQMLITFSPGHAPHQIDLKNLPYFLYHQFGMRIINHDGGPTCLSAFCQAGSLPQLNLTLARQLSLKAVLEMTSDDRISPSFRADSLAHLAERTACFFHSPDGSIPRALVPLAIAIDTLDEAAVVSFDSRSLYGQALF
ncbi:MAG: hypothetical protein OHK0047_38040 [Leptolyngbyaceae cyanobacterium]|uniref:hypothetical protein n=1 Tax=Leptodesmis sichuanensis TaxID=2906798 RepID=UPI001F344E7D|nr:hypothetical protein [Leptodesmis sichuanensis]UIE37086.1 hypothetical protein KIK02_19220 [Leptodesmis sichuanensis A121]